MTINLLQPMFYCFVIHMQNAPQTSLACAKSKKEFEAAARLGGGGGGGGGQSACT